jgi:hypothetical protein
LKLAGQPWPGLKESAMELTEDLLVMCAVICCCGPKAGQGSSVYSKRLRLSCPDVGTS